jgi:hypothetical protein
MHDVVTACRYDKRFNSWRFARCWHNGKTRSVECMRILSSTRLGCDSNEHSMQGMHRHVTADIVHAGKRKRYSPPTIIALASFATCRQLACAGNMVLHQSIVMPDESKGHRLSVQLQVVLQVQLHGD